MLTFTRKQGEVIRIGDDIRVTIKEIRGRKVRVMIEAPREIPIYREELYLQIEVENARAAQVDGDPFERLD
jgi:carbon storage regulator